MSASKSLRGATRTLAEWKPAASIVLHTRDGGTEILRPSAIQEQASLIRQEFGEAVGGDGSVCLLPNGDAPFPRLLLELVAALGMPNPVAIPDGDRTSSSLDRLRSLGVSAHALGAGSRPPEVLGARRPLPPSSLLLRTGGTSGRVRYAVNANMRRTLIRDRRLSLASALKLRDGTRALLAGSIRHAAHLSMLLDALNYQAEIHLVESSDPAQLLSLVRRYEIEWLTATPLHLRIMQRQLSDEGGTPSLRKLVHMSAACPEQVKRFWHTTLGPENVYEVFGASEGIGTTIARGDEWEERPGTVGRGFYTSIAVLDDSNRPVRPGESGEIYFHSGMNPRTLHLGQKDFVNWTSDGYVGIGDRGRLDADGYLYPEARPQLRITVGGSTILATDVEDALLDFPWIRDAAAAGINNRVTGQRVICFVVCDDDRTTPQLSEVHATLREILPSAAVPRKIIPVEAIPRSPAGKINRNLISQMAQDHCVSAKGGDVHDPEPS